MPIRQFLLACLLLPLLAMDVQAAGREEIDAYTEEALEQFYRQTSAGERLARRARGILVFPRVYKAGFGVGGEYGEGKLIVDGSTAGYYNIVSASIGFQLGAQIKTQVILFMTQEALDGFLASKGWEAGVDGSVAIATLGAGGTLDSHTLRQPIIGFIFSNKGLMYNLTLEGAKISPIER